MMNPKIIIFPPKEAFKHGDYVVFADTAKNRAAGIVGELGIVHMPDSFLGLLVRRPDRYVMIRGKEWPDYMYYFSDEIQVLPWRGGDSR
ncbi:hypothetical protein D3C85_846110 [compost metagenome]